MNTETYILYAEQKPKPEDFPIVAKWEQTPRIICNNQTLQDFISLAGRPTVWHRYIEPALPEPKKTPFEEWWGRQKIVHTGKEAWIASESYAAGDAHGRSEERKRFSEQVNALIKKFIEEGTDTLVVDLRRIAGGENI